jgi:hypothetical protein
MPRAARRAVSRAMGPTPESDDAGSTRSLPAQPNGHRGGSGGHRSGAPRTLGTSSAGPTQRSASVLGWTSCLARPRRQRRPRLRSQRRPHLGSRPLPASCVHRVAAELSVKDGPVHSQTRPEANPASGSTSTAWASLPSRFSKRATYLSPGSVNTGPGEAAKEATRANSVRATRHGATQTSAGGRRPTVEEPGLPGRTQERVLGRRVRQSH